jgi:ABC-2 type transport system permease protein
MSARITLATAARVMLQLRRDPRTIAMLLLVPCLLEVLLYYVLDGQPLVFQRIGAPLLGIFPFISMFLVTAITMLRERTTGTLERLMAMPIAKLDVLMGYGIAFGAIAAVQAALTTTVAFGLLDLTSTGSEADVVVFAIANAVLGMALGLFVSAFANTEFQAVQFLPATVFPQLLLCGLLVPRDQMADVLDAASSVLPLTYAYEGLQRVTTGPGFDGTAWRDLAIVVAVTILALALGATTLRRRTG